MRYKLSVVVLTIVFSIVSIIAYQSNSSASLSQTKTKQDEFGKEEVKFFYKTNSFQVINTEIIDDNLQITLKNNYNKSINGFYLTVGNLSGDNSSFDVELLYSDVREEILPNETFVLPVGLGKKLYTEGLTLRAVIFTDGTGDGEPDLIQEKQDVRQGEKFQLNEGIKLLKEFRISQSKNFSSKLESLKLNASSLPTKDTTKSLAYNSGLSSGKETLMYYLNKKQEYETLDELTVEQKFLQLQTKLERVVSKL